MKYLKPAVFATVLLVTMSINFCAQKSPTQAVGNPESALASLDIVKGLYQTFCFRGCYYTYCCDIAVTPSPAFDPNVLNYQITLDSMSAVGINPTAYSDSAQISVSLDNNPLPANYWVNATAPRFSCLPGTQTRTFAIAVTSKDSSSHTTYSLIVNRR